MSILVCQGDGGTSPFFPLRTALSGHDEAHSPFLPAVSPNITMSIHKKTGSMRQRLEGCSASPPRTDQRVVLRWANVGGYGTHHDNI